MKKYIFLILLVFVTVLSCEKDDNFVDPTTTPVAVEEPTPDPEPEPEPEPEPIEVSDAEFALENFGNMVTSDFIGRIIDEDGLGIENVSITIGNSMAMTNYLGIFSINDANVFDKFAHVKAEKDGYILGSRTIVPTPNATNDIQITLLTKNVIGSVTSGATSSVSLQNGAEVTFQGEFITETGTPYSGQVDVVLNYLQPNNSDTFSQMPGSLFGKREDGSAVAMETYGMLGINLFSPSGEPLNINEEFPSTLTFPVDASTPNAPLEIPLWYFDEEQGFWKEEGIATKVGNEYTAEVTHFSWWNCDIPIDSVTVCFTVNASAALANYRAEIIRNATNQIIFSGYTNQIGRECGLFPKNEIITVNIYSECLDTIIYTEQVGPFTTDDTFTINITSLPPEVVETTITGIVNDCDGNPITNGYVLIYDEADTSFSNIYMIVITNGILNFNSALCADDMYQMIVFDSNTGEQSVPIDLNLTEGTTTIGTVSTCEDEGLIYVGDVYFISQLQVDNFGLFGYTAIDGNLGIGTPGVNSTTNITSLQSLSSLTSISGNLSFVRNNLLPNLSGLENLTTISGSLEIEENSLLTNLVGLESLTTILGDFEIKKNNSLINLVGLDNLTTLPDNFIIYDNSSLTSLTGLDNLTTISGDFTIERNYGLTNLTGLDNLTTVSNLIIKQTSILNLTGLSNLTTVSGYLQIINNFAFQNLIGLPSLTTLNALSVVDNDALTSLNGLQNITMIPGYVSITDNVHLVNLVGLNNITSTGNLQIQNNPVLTSLTVLNNLTTMSGFLTIINNNALPSLIGLDNLTTAAKVNIRSNNILTDLTGLGSLTNIFQNSTVYSGELIIQSNMSLTSLTGLNNLITIDREMEIVGNVSLASLNGLENLTTVNSRIDIGNYNSPNYSLTNFCALTNLFTNGTYNINVIYIQGNGLIMTVQDIINGNCSN